jgi:uncharacterized membrane protein
MLGLSPLGIVHTLVSLVALGLGLFALIAEKGFSTSTGLGRAYLATATLAAATSLGIFRHGGPGPGHALAVLTLVAVAVGLGAPRVSALGSRARAIQTIAFTSTLLFSLIPGVTEILTRIPFGSPLVASQDAPALKPIYGFLLVGFVACTLLQLRWQRRSVGHNA